MVGAFIALILDEARRIWCYRWFAAAVSALIFGCGAAYVMSLPPVYDAWGQIYVSKQTPVGVAAQGVSLGSDGGGIYVVAKTLLNDEGLERLVRRMNPAAKGMSKAQLMIASAGMKRRIEFTPDQGDGFFEFHVRDQDPVRARRLAQIVLDEFVARNLGRSAKELREAGAFLDNQIADYEGQLTASRARMAAFQQEHPALSAAPAEEPDPNAAAELASARSAYEALRAQAPSGNARIAADAQKIAAVQARLTSLRAQYTDQHPDVLAAERELQQAKADQAADAQNQDAAPTDNPALAAARARLVEAQRHVGPRRGRAAPSPALVSEWADLQKSDELLRSNYQALVSRREAARLQQAVYGADGSSKYQITRRPTTPQFATGPNRPLLLAMVTVASVMGGLGFAYLIAAIRGIFVSPRELEQAFQLPVVGTVSWEPAWSTAPATRPGAFAAARAAVLRPFQRRNRKSLAITTTVRGA